MSLARPLVLTFRKLGDTILSVVICGYDSPYPLSLYLEFA